MTPTTHHASRAMRPRNLVPLLALGATLAGCTTLDLTNPNAQATGLFWKNQNDALAGMNAAYGSLQYIGTYGRWMAFAMDGRSDVGLSNSPWTDLANSLMPNGRTLDYATAPNGYGDRVGVQKTTYVAGLFGRTVSGERFFADAPG